MAAARAALALLPAAAGAQVPAQCRPALDWSAVAPLNACEGRQRVTLVSVGDVLLHGSLQRRGYAEGFGAVFFQSVPYLQAADIAIANLEGPVAPGFTRRFRQVADPGPVFDDVVYTEYPLFNYHPRVVDDLRAAGVDLVSFANNHTLDRGPGGVDASLAELAARGMPQTGAVAQGGARDFVTRLATPLGPVAFVACSYSTNGIADPGRQVLMCYENRAELLEIVRREAARPGQAGVVVLPHWGEEYSHSPGRAQRDLARDLAAAGAMAVIGTHPHVVQPWEALPRADGSQALVVHSTGNFVSGQGPLPRQTGLMAWLELCGAEGGGGAVVGRAGWVPVLMVRTVNGPELRVPEPGQEGRFAEARALVERLVPGRDLSGRLECRG